MCLLIHQKAGTILTPDLLEDVYRKNPDGFGALIKQPGSKPVVIKSLGNLAEINKLYDKHVANREALIHFRMKTHGNIDIDNVHPYEVNSDLWMMHNGILSIGNADNPAMSDTWHYIQKYIKPFVDARPELITNDQFNELLSAHIGSSNRFAFMTRDGDVRIINKSAGVVHEDVWYSNTYAWTPTKFGYKYSNHYSYGKTHSYYGDSYLGEYPIREKVKDKPKVKPAPTKQIEIFRPSFDKASDSDLKRIIRMTKYYVSKQMDKSSALLQWVKSHPWEAKAFIHMAYNFDLDRTKRVVEQDPQVAVELIMDVWDTTGESLEFLLSGASK